MVTRLRLLTEPGMGPELRIPRAPRDDLRQQEGLQAVCREDQGQVLRDVPWERRRGPGMEVEETKDGEAGPSGVK